MRKQGQKPRQHGTVQLHQNENNVTTAHQLIHQLETLKEKLDLTECSNQKNKLNQEIENNQDYYAMAIMITIEVAVAIVIAVATFGAGAPESAAGGAEAVAETGAAESSVSSVAQRGIVRAAQNVGWAVAVS